MASPPITVEPVESRAQLRRFADVPFVLHRDDERWRPPLRAFDRWRLDARRHPYFDRGDAAYLLARRGGHPVGRIAAHVPDRRPAGGEPPEGRFGFFDVPDDASVVGALLDAAAEWLDEQGAHSMTGPYSWTADEERGVLVDGFERAATTGRPWHPPWYAERLVAAGLAPGPRYESHRIDVEATDVAAEPPPPGERQGPAHAGRLADPRIVLDAIAAVPDVSGLLQGTSVRTAWRTARAVRDGAVDTAVCVRCDGDPATAVPPLVAASRAAGYRWLLAPWSPDGGPAGETPETVHQVFERRW